MKALESPASDSSPYSLPFQTVQDSIIVYLKSIKEVNNNNNDNNNNNNNDNKNKINNNNTLVVMLLLVRTSLHEIKKFLKELRVSTSAEIHYVEMVPEQS